MAKKKVKITPVILKLVEERNQYFNTMVSNQDKISEYKRKVKQYTDKNNQFAGFINTLDRRILNEAGVNPNSKTEED